MKRSVIHVNAAAFPIQIERLKNRKLQKRPLVIAPPDDRAVIYMLSDEARQVGIRPGMPVSAARKYCRDVVVLPPNEPLYYRVASEMNRILEQFSPVIEPVQQGHTFMDVTGTQRLFGGAVDSGYRAQQEVEKRFQLDLRVGVGTNKLVSKLAADAAASKDLKNVEPGTEADFVSPFQVHLLPLVTRKVQAQLSDLNIHRVRELVQVSLADLTTFFGRPGFQLYDFARGIDSRPVLPPTRIPAIVEMKLLDQDTNDLGILQAILLVLVESAVRQLRQNKWVAKKIRLFVRHSDYKDQTTEARFSAPAAVETEIFPIASQLLDQALRRRVRVRQLAIKLWGLQPRSNQLSFFQPVEPAKPQKLLSAMEKIRQRFGNDAIQFARTMTLGDTVLEGENAGFDFDAERASRA
ncbi:hypothetical protein JW964_28325 [candidate division KSB1 bacterium]|nr:hypothetical protein [candidate division KSB1 bacterium]